MADRLLQAGLAAGMSATSCVHRTDPVRVGPDFDGSQLVVDEAFIPRVETRVTLRGKYKDSEVPIISWGAWSWGDKATWNWSDDELPGLQEAWKLCVKNGLTLVDTAQAYGGGESE